ncbi:ATPase [Philodulcilactobacillus myokoensis]|uniref:ATPase n=1 Tax=Philodulcilactobacillus myokoensis TaxID=2929573 RepID=A0A9W6B120_9LACO|nr:ATP-binding protein [Philodulcilactobacillus myokoensis]GLB46826.1 ATPase [Philodulcilactobacillus myokoensis]
MALSYRDMLMAASIVVRAGNVPNIVGEAGIGKSALVRELAQKNHAKLFTTVVSLSEKGDLSIPVPPLTSDSFIKTDQYGELADVQFGYSHTLIQIIQHAQKAPKQPIYWFLDEFNRGTQAVQSELMNLVLQRSINSLKLPDQVHIIIAENPDSTMAGFENSNYGVAAGDDAIKDRTVRLVMQSSSNDWIKWAESINPPIHHQVIEYIKAHPEMLHPDIDDHDLIPTPRAWKRVSDDLYQLDHLTFSERQHVQLEILKGNLGIETATNFDHFINHHQLNLLAENLMNDSFEHVLNTFKRMDETQKFDLLMNLVHLNPKIDENFGLRFAKLLKNLSPDGQYSLVLQLSNQTSILNQVYQNIDQNTEKLRQLYVLFEQISLS